MIFSFPRFSRSAPRNSAALFVVLAIGLLLFPVRSLATTYYVDAASAGGDGSSWAQAFTTIGAGLGAAQSGDVVEVSGGEYVETLSTVRDGVTVTGSETSGHNGTVTVKGGDGQTVLSVSHASTWKRITFDGSANTHQYTSVVSINAGAPTFEDCVIGPGMQLLAIGTGGATFSRCTIAGARRGYNYGQVVTIAAGSAGAVTFNYCLFGDMQFGYIRPDTASKVEFNNCLLAGFSGYVLYSDSGASIPGGVHLQNCLLMANGYSTPYLIQSKSAAAPVTLTHCLTQPRSPVNIMDGDRFSTNVTEENPLTPGSPELTHGRRVALFNLGIDDAIHVDFWAQVAAMANSRGIPTTLALDADDDVSNADWQTMQTLVNAGNEVAAHTAHHVYLPEKNLLVLTYTGTATDATVTVVTPDTGTAASTLTLDVPSENFSVSYDLSSDSFDTIAEVQAAINALTDFSASLVSIAHTSYTSGPVLSRDLGAVTATSLPPDTDVTLARNDTQFYADEISEPKATIEAHLTAANGGAYTCASFVYPFLGTDDASIAAVGAAGYTAARGGYTGSFALGGYYDGPTPGGYNALDIWSSQPGTLLGRNLDAATLAERVSALVEWAKFTGVAIGLFSHGANEYTLDEWTALVDQLRADPEVQFGTLHDIQTYLAANAQSVSNNVYIRTNWPNVADYRPILDSSLLNAGTPYDQVMEDFSGKVVPAGTTPTVSLYQVGGTTPTGTSIMPPTYLLLLLQDAAQ